MSLEIKGKVIRLLDAQGGTSKAGKEWKKQEFVIETQEQFPREVCFTLFGDKMELLNGIQEGETVNVGFNLESREYNGRYFHNINAWKIDKEMANAAADAPVSEADLPPMPDINDLPF